MYSALEKSRLLMLIRIIKITSIILN